MNTIKGCQVEEMRQVQTGRGRANRERLQQIMTEQGMGQARIDKWLKLIEGWA